MESLGYVLINCFRGSLPWAGFRASSNLELLRMTGEVKQRTPIDELCQGCPPEMECYMSYCRRLGFEDLPDYDMLRSLFAQARSRLSEERGSPMEDHEFEWNDGRVFTGLESLKPPAQLRQPDSRCNWLSRRFLCRGAASRSRCSARSSARCTGPGLAMTRAHAQGSEPRTPTTKSSRRRSLSMSIMDVRRRMRFGGNKAADTTEKEEKRSAAGPQPLQRRSRTW